MLKRRVGKTRHSDELLPVEWAFLRDEPRPRDGDLELDNAWWSMEGFAGGWEGPFKPRDYGYGIRPSVGDMWMAVGMSILEEWIKTKPGTRPDTWWLFAPEPRKPGESQRSYLLQHNCLLPGEAERLDPSEPDD